MLNECPEKAAHIGGRGNNNNNNNNFVFKQNFNGYFVVPGRITAKYLRSNGQLTCQKQDNNVAVGLNRLRNTLSQLKNGLKIKFIYRYQIFRG